MVVSKLIESLVYESGAVPSDVEVAERFRVWINDAVEEILAEGPYPILNNAVGLSVVAGVSEYAVSPTTADLRSITENATGSRLSYLPPDELAARQLRLDQTGSPAVWWYSGFDPDSGSALIRVWPTPDADRVYTAYGHPRLVSALTETSVIPLPEDFLLVVRHYVRALAAEQQVKDEVTAVEAERKRGRYETALLRLKSRFKSPPARWAVMQPRDVAPVDPFGVPQYPDIIS